MSQETPESHSAPQRPKNALQVLSKAAPAWPLPFEVLLKQELRNASLAALGDSIKTQRHTVLMLMFPSAQSLGFFKDKIKPSVS